MNLSYNHIDITRNNIDNLISFEMKQIKNARTPRAALTFIPHIFGKLENDPKIKAIIKEVEKDLEKEKNIRQENLEKSVLWFCEKIKLLLTNCNFSCSIMEDARDLLDFKVFSLSSENYIDLLNTNLTVLLSEVSKNEKNHEFLKEWTKNDENSGFCIRYPVYDQKSFESIFKESDYKAWKERGYLSLSFLVEFLKTLSSYDKFEPIFLKNLHCKNLKEYMQMQYQASMGYYFSAFNSDDPLYIPLANSDIILLIDSLIERLAEKLEPKVHWRSDYKNKDVEKLIPIAKVGWKKEIYSLKHPHKIGVKKLAEKLSKEIPPHLYLNCKGEKIIARMVNAVKQTDPRKYENGRFKELSPGWDDF